jgi:hypothetical protein
MSAPDFDFLVNPSLPSHDTIVALCEAAGDERTGIPLHDPSSGLIIAWVKYGPYVAMAEALTQDYVAKFLVANSVVDVRVPRVYAAFPTRKRSLWDFGYIIMEYIDAPDCGEEDYRLAAKAVQKLISIKGPNDVPGPIGGGRAVHTFFVEWTSPINYTTVGELQQHINGVSVRKSPVRLDDLRPWIDHQT